MAVIALAWLLPGRQFAAAAGMRSAARQASSHLVSERYSSAPAGSRVRQDASSYPTSCIASSASCYASVSPAVALVPIGSDHTLTFLCGAPSSSLVPPGCFDVTVSAQDVTTGSTANIISATCGTAGATLSGGSVSCTNVSNPICAVGMTGAGACAPTCPSGFIYSSVDGLCHIAPSGSPQACPAGSTPVTNSSNAPIDCTAAATPSAASTVTATISSGAPHVFRVDFTGYIGTTTTGTCPAGTTYAPIVTFTPTGGAAPITGPACAFTVSAETKYLEGTSLTIKPTSPCGGSIAEGFASLMGGASCFFQVQALGTVVLKTGVNCSDPGEPVNGTQAPGLPKGSVYECVDGALTISHVPVPGIKVHLHAVDGYFSPTCIPNSRVTPPLTGTVTPTVSATATPVATNTPTPVTATATPAPAGTTAAAFCGPPGQADVDVVTNANGIAGAYGQIVTFSAQAQPPFVPVGGNETVIGRFLIDQTGIANIPMYATFHFVSGDVPCDAMTDSTGTAQCTRNVGVQASGSIVPVDVSFVDNCTEYDTAASFVVGSPVTPMPAPTVAVATEPAPAGICVVRSGYGTLTVDASYASVVNTQPSLSTGPIALGEYGIPTSTPVPTATAAPPTSTPPATAASATSTVVPTPAASPTATNTATPQPTNTPLPTATPTPVVLSFSLDAARVATANNPGNHQGLDVVHGGQKVRLMMYYTIRGIPKPLTRITTYQIRDSTGRIIYRVSFKGTEKPGDTGHFIRYTYYVAPTSMPVGRYEFQATLKIGSRSQTRAWYFAIPQTVSRIALARNVLHDRAVPKR